MPVNNRGIYEYAETDLDSTASDMLNRQSQALSAAPVWIAAPMLAGIAGYAEYCVMAGVVHFRAGVTGSVAADTRINVCTLPEGIRPTGRVQVLTAVALSGRPATSYIFASGVVNFRNMHTAASASDNFMSGSWPKP